jgi:hypothetical protein
MNGRPALRYFVEGWLVNILSSEVKMKRILLALAALLSIGLGQSQAGPVTGGLVQWFRADAGVTTDPSGNVSFWADQSGHSNNAIATGVGPQLVANALNGNPVLRFDGLSQFLTTNNVLTSQQFTIMAVVNDTRTSGDSSFREVYSNWSPFNTTTSVFLGTANTNPVRARFTDDMGGANDPVHTQTGVGVISNPATHFIFTGVSGASDATIYQNTNLIADKGSPLSTRDLTGAYHIGTQGPQGGFESWQGDMAEILVYDRELSPTELQQNWSYLSQKYFPAATPEPASLTLVGIGIAGLLGYGYRRRQAPSRAVS